jgi:hypothetical protein
MGTPMNLRNLAWFASFGYRGFGVQLINEMSALANKTGRKQLSK